MAIGAVSGVTGTGYLPRATGASASDTPGTTGTAFAGSLSGALGQLQSLQSNANTLAVQAVTGDLGDIHRATIAATRAQTTLELVATVRNQAITGFNEMMRMQA